jgi:DNA-binding NtrC family response regulator
MKKPKISETFDEMHERFLIEALRITNNNKKNAAKLLGIAERTVHNKIIKYGINEIKKGAS